MHSKLAGFATSPEVGKNRALVLKIIVSQTNWREDPDPDFSVMLYPQVNETMDFSLHEGIHIWGDGIVDQEVIDTPDGKRIKERRGFHIFFFREDGQVDKNMNFQENKALPHQAIDEGTVVLLDCYANNSSSLHNIDSAIESRNENNGYKSAAKITAKVAEVVGMDTLLRCYVRSDLEGWLNKIQDILGETGLNSYLATMRGLQGKLSPYS